MGINVATQHDTTFLNLFCSYFVYNIFVCLLSSGIKNSEAFPSSFFIFYSHDISIKMHHDPPASVTNKQNRKRATTTTKCKDINYYNFFCWLYNNQI